MKGWKLFWQKNREKAVMTVLILFCLVATVISICFGVAKMTNIIFWYIRLPRTLACLLAGAGLAVAGAVIQGVLANKLASPGMLGVNAGAGLAVTVCCALGTVHGWTIAGASFLGALFAVLIISFVAQKINASRITVILGGVAVNSFLNAVSESIRTLVPEAGVMSADFRVGGFSAVSHARLIPAGILIVIALVILFTLHNELDLMILGEDMAQGLGLSVKKMRTIFLVLVAVLAGASVSFAGLLSFVGLIIPHILRRIVGAESKILLRTCAVAGAGFVLVCDLAARFLFVPYEIPVGILMSFIGGPFFIWLLLKQKGGHAHD